jgi:TDG/mug DNA glycosylase family protein
VLFVGINPGVRSAAIGHHFAGYSNRFWKLLFDSGLTPERLSPEEDARLAEWGLGVTNLIPRCTAGIDALRRDEYVAGIRTLRRKVRRWRPDAVVFVGVTLFRVVFARPPRAAIALGLQRETFEGSRVFVLPNPSGRNANFSYGQMLAAFTAVRTVMAGEPARIGRPSPRFASIPRRTPASRKAAQSARAERS